MLKICKFIENKKTELIQTSGYCIINLIYNKILEEKIKLDDNNIIDFSFTEYDYDKNNNRNSNEQYVKYAEKAIDKLKLGRNL